jgi:hypothetical protein
MIWDESWEVVEAGVLIRESTESDEIEGRGGGCWE